MFAVTLTQTASLGWITTHCCPILILFVVFTVIFAVFAAIFAAAPPKYLTAVR